MNARKFSLLVTTIMASMALSACQTTGTTPSAKETREQQIDSALERATAKAVERSGGTQSPDALEKDYKNNAEDAQGAIKYAKSLREDDQLNRAAMVLEPFASDAASPAAAKTEYAAILLAQGNYESAEEYGKKAVMQDDQDHEAYHYLGIALDAQGKHPEAERAFRKALDHWEGDPTTVMNNLALNLAAQEYLDEAIEILYKAKAISPNRIEVERNLRIVMALQQSSGHRSAPKPKKRPDDGSAAMPVIKPVQKTIEAERDMPAVESPAVTAEPIEDAPAKESGSSKSADKPARSGNE